MMARVRSYSTYDEAISEWRRFGIPEEFVDRKRLLGRTIVYRDDLDREEAGKLVSLIKDSGEDAFLCRKTKRPRVMVSCNPSFFDRISLDEGDLGRLGRPLAEAFMNFHSDYVPPLRLGRRELRFDRPLVMGILNVTPDSFYDGGSYSDAGTAVKRGSEMADEGADIIDIGGESTRPGSEPVSAGEEMARVLPVIKDLAPSVKVPISIDTRHASVAEKALEMGAEIVNDVSGLEEGGMIDVLRQSGAGAVVMHKRGEPSDMQKDTLYEDVVGDIGEYLTKRVRVAAAAGIDPARLVIDPGIGFSKEAKGNLEIIRRLREFRSYGRPILIGASRKNFIGRIVGGEPAERLEGSLASAACAIMNGANIVRVHDVKETVKVARMVDAIRSPSFRV